MSLEQFVVARDQQPSCYPSRSSVRHPSWSEEDDGYAPSEFTHDVVTSNADDISTGGQWADVQNSSPPLLGKRKTFVGHCREDAVCISDTSCAYDTKRQRYLFPGGRTGIIGRGLLGRFGPNHAADPIVTRMRDGKLQVIFVLRNDGSGMLAFPGGMVDVGATHTETLKAEFTQEACLPGGAVDRLFSQCEKRTVYRGPVDDWRTTDEAWIETVAVHFHAPDDIASSLDLEVTDKAEVIKVGWHDAAAVVDSMYASHGALLKKVVLYMEEEELILSRGPGASYSFARR